MESNRLIDKIENCNYYQKKTKKKSLLETLVLSPPKASLKWGSVKNVHIIYNGVFYKVAVAVSV